MDNWIFSIPFYSEVINHHAPVKKIKVTRPPAPRMHDPEIRYLQYACFKIALNFAIQETKKY